MRSICRVLLVFAVSAWIAPAAAAKPAHHPHATSGIARHHMIAVATPYAAQAGLEMLRAHGSAVDAAIAAQLVLTLVEPESSGIGGGAFVLLYDPAKKQVTSFDGREIAPASATPSMFLDASSKPRAHFDAIPGGLSVGVPGVIAMLELAHKRYGRLPWAKLFGPAIALADKGFPVGRKLAATLKAFPQMAQMPDVKRYFYKPDGTPLGEGEILKNPELAKTLRAIAQNGAQAFYSGPIAQSIVDAVQHAPVNPGGMTLADLASYRPRELPPVCGTYRGYRLCSMGPPSSGGVGVIQILSMLQHFPSKSVVPGTLLGTHLFTQASRLAFADRAKYLGDTSFVDVPLAGLLDDGYLADRAKLIDPNKDMGMAEAGTPPEKHAEYAPQRTPQLPGTSHMSIVDDHGEVVSMTTTVEFVFGSETMASGFFLNNQLTDFSFEPTRNGVPVANAPAPGKRPLSAMSPTLVFDPKGHFAIAAGSPGGPVIIDYTTEALLAMIDGHLTPQAAAAQPKVANLNGPTIIEKGTALEALVPQLTAMGHTIREVELESGLHIIERVKGGYIGGADPRRDGVAIGD
jgi:gamma-glutamyltranspeptidase/glutathione hydrolase